MLYPVAVVDDNGVLDGTDDMSEIVHGTPHEESFLQIDEHSGPVQDIYDTSQMREVSVRVGAEYCDLV